MKSFKIKKLVSLLTLSKTAAISSVGVAFLVSGCSPLGSESQIVGNFSAGLTSTPSPTATPASSSSVTSATTIASLSFTTAPITPVTTDATNTIAVTAYDSSSAVVADDSSSSITLTAYSTSDCSGTSVGSALSTTSATLSSGVASFSSLGILKVSVHSIAATSGSVSVCSGSLSVTAGALASFGFSTQPVAGASADVNLATQPVVVAYDANSNIKTDYTGTVTLSANSNAASCGIVSDIGAAASGNSVAAVAGVATFTTVRVLKTSGVRLRAYDGSIQGCSSSFVVNPGAVTSIAFSTNPAPLTIDTDTAFTTQPVVKAYDVNSNVVTTNSALTITLTAYSDACTTSVASGLSATTNPVTLANGVATFAALKSVKTNVVRIGASDGTHTACSSAIVTNPGAINSIAWGTAPSTSYTASSSTPMTTFTAKLLDANLNTITTNSTTTVTVARTTGTSALGGTVTRTVASGIATFDDITYNTAETMKLTATENTGSHSVVSGSIVVGAALDLTDNSLTTFGGGSFSGVSAYSALVGESSSSGLKLGNNGGCDGSTSSCAQTSIPEVYQLSSSWAPQWNHIVGLWHLDEPSGSTTFADSTGLGRTGTLTGSGAWTIGTDSKIGKGITTNYTTGDYTTNHSAIVVANHASLNPTNITIGAWIKPPYQSSWEALVLKKTSGTDGYGIVNIANVGVDAVYFFVNGRTNYVGVPTTIDTWQYVVGTYDGTTLRMYKNGKLISSAAYAGPMVATTGDLSIGNNDVAPINYYGWHGGIDEMAIWNVALNDAEVAAIYERQAPKYSGTFTSRILDSLSSVSWTAFSWTPTLPFLKPLVDFLGTIRNEIADATHYSSLASSTLMTGLVGLWHLDEPDGMSAANSVIDTSKASGSADNGTPQGSPTFGVLGKFNTGVFLNSSSSQYITIPSTTNITPTAAMTVSGWFFQSSLATNKTLFSKWNYSSDGGFAVQTDNSDSSRLLIFVAAYSTDNGTGCNMTTAAGAWTTGWHHVAIVYDGSLTGAGTARLKLYIDGVNSALTIGTGGLPATLQPSTAPFEIGRWQGIGRYWDGAVDEVAMWSRALSATEVLQLYQRGASRLKFQVRSCADSTCSANPTWQGPDGSANTYFSELNNTSTQAATPSGTVNIALPSMTLQNYTSPIGNNQYLQYRTIFESDSSNTALMPELKSVKGN